MLDFFIDTCKIEFYPRLFLIQGYSSIYLLDKSYTDEDNYLYRALVIQM